MHNKKIVVDASVAVDLFAARDPSRVEAAEKLFRCVSPRSIGVYVPRLFLAEVAGVLVRFLRPGLVRNVVMRLGEEVTAVGDSLYFEKSIEVALATGSRGADAYYVGLAGVLDAPLATSDRVQALNASRAGIQAFYILDQLELEELLRRLGCSK